MSATNRKWNETVMNPGVQALLAVGGIMLLIAVGTVTPLGAIVLLMAMIPFVLIARLPAPDRSPSPKPANKPAPLPVTDGRTAAPSGEVRLDATDPRRQTTLTTSTRRG